MCSHCVSFVEAIKAKLEARRLTNRTIRDVVAMWCNPATRQAVVDKYGEIGDWDVSRVTSMYMLFAYQRDFNENISGWDTANVRDMCSTFLHASSFNQPAEGWDTANVTIMNCTFQCLLI